MGQLIAVRNKTIFQFNVCILSHSKSHLSLNFARSESWCFLFNHKSLNSSTVVLISGPHDHITKSCVTNPSFVAINYVSALDFMGSRPEASRITSIFWLSQAKAEDLIEAHAFWQPSLLLLFVS